MIGETGELFQYGLIITTFDVVIIVPKTSGKTATAIVAKNMGRSVLLDLELVDISIAYLAPRTVDEEKVASAILWIQFTQSQSQVELGINFIQDAID
jgi:hypothetical protein